MKKIIVGFSLVAVTAFSVFAGEGVAKKVCTEKSKAECKAKTACCKDKKADCKKACDKSVSKQSILSPKASESK